MADDLPSEIKQLLDDAEHGGYVTLGQYSSESDVVFGTAGEERGQVWMVGNENFPAVTGSGDTLRRQTYAEWLAEQ